MRVEESSLPGCKQLFPDVRTDERGYFVKTFNRSTFAGVGLDVDFPEHFFSESKHGVIRGMHFQLPPSAQAKVVFCPAGEVLDVVVDLRNGSPTFGKAESFRLDSARWNALYIPVGFAHGFAALADTALMAYLVSSEYAPEVDTGIRWDSFGFRWPFDEPVISERDRALPALERFVSPFRFEPE